MSLDTATLFTLARNFTNSVYNNAQDFLSVSRVQQTVIAAALQGQFSVAFEYPKTVSQALLIEQQGNTPDFSADVLNYYKTATSAVVESFRGSQFVLSGLPNAGGFKVSWSNVPVPTAAPVVEAVAVDAKDNIVVN